MAERESWTPPFEYSLSAGYRRDNLRWSIADGSTNIASEVEWKNTVIAQLRAAGKLNLPDRWLLRGYFATGAVRSGSSQDSDYAASNRTQPYSISNNRSGGAVRDLSLALGKSLDLDKLPNGVSIQVIPLVGMSVHQQNFTMVDGVQTLPANGAFAGLHNSYDSKWQGAWLGMDVLLGLNDKLTVTATGEYHRADYTAEANWNLRNEFAHPVSFRHVAKGYGLLGTVAGEYRFNRNVLLNALLGYQRWLTSGGYDQTFFSSGSTAVYPLNEVRWSSWSLLFGMAYQF